MKKINKYRGKRKKTNTWVYGDLIQKSTKKYIMPFNDGDWQDNEVYPKTVGQYIGIKSEKNTEIYEDDIVVKNCYLWFNDGLPNYRGLIEWIFSQWQVVAYCINKNTRGISDGINEGINDDGVEENEKSEWIILGNKHDNAELLNKEP